MHGKVLRRKLGKRLKQYQELKHMMIRKIYDCGEGGGGGGSGGGGTWPSSLSLQLQPSNMFGCRNGVRGLGPPAFLTKTYNIVDDLNTNSVISWSLLGNSFIIWDHLQFSAEILPKYFKHSNFSSFIYQLNNYGFRKIGVDHQWEYENPNFQVGKEYLLPNIKRRNQKPEKIAIRRGHKRTPYHKMEIRPEILRNGINESKMEIQKLKRQQEEMEFHIMAFEEKVKSIENKSRRLMVYWAKAWEEAFAQKIREKTGKENNGDNDPGLDKPESPLMDNPEKTEKNPDDQEEMGKEEMIPLPEKTVLSTDDGSGSQVQQDQEGIDGNSETGPMKNSGDYMFWKKILLEDDENEARTEMADQQAKIALDLEGLIAKLADQENE